MLVHCSHSSHNFSDQLVQMVGFGREMTCQLSVTILYISCGRPDGR
jgi:hypothetical protein